MSMFEIVQMYNKTWNYQNDPCVYGGGSEGRGLSKGVAVNQLDWIVTIEIFQFNT